MVAMLVVVPAAVMEGERTDFPTSVPSATTQRGFWNSCSLTLAHTTLTGHLLDMEILTTPIVCWG